MAGVYDISEHLKYEAGRGVRYLSTMERALGGEGQFPRQSPSVILSCAAGISARGASPDGALTPGCAVTSVHPRLQHVSVLPRFPVELILARIGVWCRSGNVCPGRTAVSASAEEATSDLSKYTQHMSVQSTFRRCQHQSFPWLHAFLYSQVVTMLRIIAGLQKFEGTCLAYQTAQALLMLLYQ